MLLRIKIGLITITILFVIVLIIIGSIGTNDLQEFVFKNNIPVPRNLIKSDKISEFQSFLQCENSTRKNIQNFYLIKSYKAASSTLSNVLYRYGLKHDLSFVEPYAIQTNQIFPFSHLDTVSEWPLIPSCGITYNLSTIHSRYEGKELLERTMPKGTRIFASVRNPVSQFLSSFSYLPFGQILKKNGIDFDRFIENPLKYSREYLDFPKEMKVLDKPLILAHWNMQSQVFGLYDYKIPPGIGRSEILQNVSYKEEIEKFLDRVDREVEFVFITEYFMESMAIFRNMFQLDYSDVAHFPINSAIQDNSKDKLSEKQQDLIIEWSYIDWLLYEKMLVKFEIIKSSLKYDLSYEVANIEKLNSRIAEFCLTPEMYRIVQELCKVKWIELSKKGSKNVCCQRIAEREGSFNHILRKIMKDKLANC
ncbi:Galactosylceramide sulfotransferase-like [Oopsacas minuta]|uniref:Galactosylceramide sulfotransferase-like n=1 Tax=Oopsacas minuta TaxID=111878 RepID=A0AAV7JPC8_9METZ|nr:Galactosylceramide sulfotransferase-like [Oopsacas minuta]